MKKKLKILIIIAFIVAIILLLLLFLKKVNYIEREEMTEIVLNGIDNLNYETSLSDGEKSIIVGKKEKIITPVVEKYFDYENCEVYTYYVGNQYSELNTGKNLEQMEYYKDFISKYFNSDSFNYEYIGLEDNFYIVKFKSKSQASSVTSITFWINKDNGIISKSEKQKVGNKDKVIDIYEYDSGKYSESEVTVTDEIKSYKDAILETNR